MIRIEEQLDISEQRINKKVARAQASGGIVSVLRQSNGKFTLRAIFFEADGDEVPPPTTAEEVTNTGEAITDAPWFQKALAEL